MSDRSERRDITKVSNYLKNGPVSILMAARYAAKKNNMKYLGEILNQIITKPENVAEMKQMLQFSCHIRTKSAEEALAFLLNNNLSKEVNTNFRLETISSGADVWTPYNAVRDA